MPEIYLSNNYDALFHLIASRLSGNEATLLIVPNQIVRKRVAQLLPTLPIYTASAGIAHLSCLVTGKKERLPTKAQLHCALFGKMEGNTHLSGKAATEFYEMLWHGVRTTHPLWSSLHYPSPEDLIQRIRKAKRLINPPCKVVTIAMQNAPRAFWGIMEALEQKLPLLHFALSPSRGFWEGNELLHSWGKVTREPLEGWIGESHPTSIFIPPKQHTLGTLQRTILEALPCEKKLPKDESLAVFRCHTKTEEVRTSTVQIQRFLQKPDNSPEEVLMRVADPSCYLPLIDHHIEQIPYRLYGMNLWEHSKEMRALREALQQPSTELLSLADWAAHFRALAPAPLEVLDRLEHLTHEKTLFPFDFALAQLEALSKETSLDKEAEGAAITILPLHTSYVGSPKLTLFIGMDEEVSQQRGAPPLPPIPSPTDRTANQILESLISTRERVLFTYTGTDPLDGKERMAALWVEELLDIVAAREIVPKEPKRGRRGDAVFSPTINPQISWTPALLRACLANPIRFYLQHILECEERQQEEPLQLDALTRHKIMEESLEKRVEKSSLSLPSGLAGEVVERQLQRRLRQRDLLLGEVGELFQGQLCPKAAKPLLCGSIYTLPSIQGVLGTLPRLTKRGVLSPGKGEVADQLKALPALLLWQISAERDRVCVPFPTSLLFLQTGKSVEVGKLTSKQALPMLLEYANLCKENPPPLLASWIPWFLHKGPGEIEERMARNLFDEPERYSHLERIISRENLLDRKNIAEWSVLAKRYLAPLFEVIL